MNTKLFDKVKKLCKDTGLSEKYLKAITEKLGGSIEDDSTDDAAIDETANLIADVAKESQGEATRWATTKKKVAKKKPQEDSEEEDEEDSEEEEKKKQPKKDPVMEELGKLRQELETLRTEKEKGARAKQIADAMEKHKIPNKFRNRFAKSISDDEDVDEVVAQLKQDFVTGGLVSEDSEGSKAASEKQVSDAANSLLESITVK